jgi:phosphatidylethanolamine-binding protein (PEBP) family uncharacterized protein
LTLALGLGFALGTLSGCGSSSSSDTVPVSPAGAVKGATTSSPSSVDAVAYVASTPIPKASYKHWLSVERVLAANDRPSNLALGFLLTSEWVIDEAHARGISVSEAEVKQHLSQVERQTFPKAGTLQKFLANSGETESDLLARAKVELLQARISAKITAGKSSSQASAVLAGFERSFQQHWKRYTNCEPEYVMEDCSEFKGKPVSHASAPPPPALASAPAPGSSKPRAPSTPFTVNPRTGASETDGEIPPRPAGDMTLSSSAFGLNESIPAEYTCDGAGVSPPLEWKDVPANARALILFVIDDDTPLPQGGIRWLVGDISPSSKGVAAGATPTGGVLGVNAEGHAAYGSICPAHGAITRVEFLLYALKKPIPLSTGFEAAAAEREYGRPNNLVIGKVAVTYAGYQRP